MQLAKLFSTKGILMGWGATMTFLGVYMMLQPEFVVAYYSLTPQDATGWSALSGNFAALITVLGLSAILGVTLRNPTWILNAILIETIILAGRFIAFINYGITESVLVLITAEVFIGVVMLKHLFKYK